MSYTARTINSRCTINVFRSVVTPLGRFHYNQNKIGLAAIGALAVGAVALFGGTGLGLQLGGSLVASVTGLFCSAVSSFVSFLGLIKA